MIFSSFTILVNFLLTCPNFSTPPLKGEISLSVKSTWPSRVRARLSLMLIFTATVPFTNAARIHGRSEKPQWPRLSLQWTKTSACFLGAIRLCFPHPVLVQWLGSKPSQKPKCFFFFSAIFWLVPGHRVHWMANPVSSFTPLLSFMAPQIRASGDLCHWLMYWQSV